MRLFKAVRTDEEHVAHVEVNKEAKVEMDPYARIADLERKRKDLIKEQETVAREVWEDLPTFPMRDAKSLCCPICGSGVSINRAYADHFIWYLKLDAEGYRLISDAFYGYPRDTYVAPFRGSVAEMLIQQLDKAPTMTCKCSCGYEWRMKVPTDGKMVYTRKLFCQFCGCNYDREKNESCPGCGGRDE